MNRIYVFICLEKLGQGQRNLRDPLAHMSKAEVSKLRVWIMSKTVANLHACNIPEKLWSFNSSPPSAAYVSVNRVNVGSDNGLSSIRRQVIIGTNAGLLSIGLLGTNFSEISIKIQNFLFKKMPLKMPSAKNGGHLVQGEMS